MDMLWFWFDEHPLCRCRPPSLRVQAGLMFVRYFDDEDGGYSRAMSWGCHPIRSSLARMGADLQADEYAGDFTVHGSIN
jgi:hypothetical protein